MKVWVAWACTCLMVMMSTEYVCAFPTAAENNHHQHILKAYSVKFTTKKATRNSYLLFMKDLFNALTDHGDRSGPIPVLPRDWSSLPASWQYVYVDLSNGEETVRLALNASNAYLLGYVAQDGRSYFFRDVPTQIRYTIFPDSTQQDSLPFGVNYDYLEAAAGVGDRREIPLGINELSNAIRSLYYGRPNSGGGASSSVARALITGIQMAIEAVRLRTIQEEILGTIQGEDDYGQFYPTDLTLELETSWTQLSAGVQSATDGVFSRPVTLSLGGGRNMVFNTVRQVLFIVALMQYVCSPPRYQQLQPSLILPSAATAVRSALENRNDDDSCVAFTDPTVCLLGQDGLCADVYKDYYNDVNKVILSPCGGPDQVNQLWTLRRRDQTIRSNGKCLTTSGHAAGSHVMIYDCDTATVEATKWEVLSDGTIRNPTSGLVLTAIKDTSSDTTNVVVDHNYYAARQAWAATNVTKPLVTKIAGYDNLCLQTAGSGGGVDVLLGSCMTNSNADEWLVYPDGTIRPCADNESCLQYELGRPVVTIGSCQGSVEERWLFQSDGTILQVFTQQVIDVKDTGATVLQVTIDDPNPDRLSQVWFQLWL